MIVYHYFNTQNIIAMWYYNEHMTLRLWTLDLDSGCERDSKAASNNINFPAEPLSDEVGWRELLWDVR